MITLFFNKIYIFYKISQAATLFLEPQEGNLKVKFSPLLFNVSVKLYNPDFKH